MKLHLRRQASDNLQMAPIDALPAPQLLSHAFAQGWVLMASLIVAIGAQNALVLRQGLRREHVGAVVSVCFAADALLVAAGVFGLGALVARSAFWLEALRLFGAAFLTVYALRSAWRACRGDASTGLAPAAEAAATPISRTLTTTLALTLLNPHVYLDTVVLVGAVGAQLPAAARLPFAGGAGTASLMWFVALGFGARALAPRLQSPGVWRALDAVVALVMGLAAARLWGAPV